MGKRISQDSNGFLQGEGKGQWKAVGALAQPHSRMAGCTPFVRSVRLSQDAHIWHLVSSCHEAFHPLGDEMPSSKHYSIYS